MDALYGMLAALGQDAPDDPAELDRLLREQTEKLKDLIAERDALKSADPEIVRLSALADKAIDEGALNTALRLLERAKTRVGELEKTVDEAEAEIRARRIEFAEVYRQERRNLRARLRPSESGGRLREGFPAGGTMGRSTGLGIQGP